MIENLERTVRIERLKQVYSDTPWSVSAKRAIIYTKAWMETEGEPILIRRAKAFRSVLEQSEICVRPDELLVGSCAEKERQAPLFPEMDVEWLEKELLTDTEAAALGLAADDIEQLKAILPYWHGKTLKDNILKGLPQRTLDARADSLFNVSMHEDSGLGHLIPDFEAMLAEGLGSMRQRCVDGLAGCSVNVPEGYRRSLFYQSAIIHLDAISALMVRYADAAKAQAATETDPARVAELNNMAEGLIHISTQPAATFHQSVQFMWFFMYLIQLESNGSSVSIGRFDKVTNPYYVKDVAAGRLTPKGAQELIDCFYLKLAGIFKARPASRKSLQSGITRYQDLTLGGVDEYGRDITNDITYMGLTARMHCNTVDPQLSLRVHDETPSALMKKASDVIKNGGGHPALYSDKVIIASLLYRGVPLHRARDYSLVGCVEIAYPGLWGRNDGGYTNMVKALELTLDDVVGKDRRGQFKCLTEVDKVDTFESFYKYYEKVLGDVIDHQAAENNLIDMVNEAYLPEMMCSLVTPGCIESGYDVTSGGAEMNWTTPLGVGLSNVANSLYTIRDLVYDKKEMSMADLWQVLSTDWEGQEALRQKVLHLPKYGNDIEAVDSLAAQVANTYYHEIERQRNHRDSGFYPALYSLTSNVPLGWATAATPDGRKASTPFAEGVSPTHGTDVNGPTAALRSVARVDWLPATGGIILNQKFNPALLQGEEEIQCLIDLVLTYLNTIGGAQIQFNIISREELLAAQEHPEAHGDLIVRVTGYSARFVELSRQVQDDIIARTEHQHL